MMIKSSDPLFYASIARDLLNRVVGNINISYFAYYELNNDGKSFYLDTNSNDLNSKDDFNPRAKTVFNFFEKWSNVGFYMTSVDEYPDMKLSTYFKKLNLTSVLRYVDYESGTKNEFEKIKCYLFAVERNSTSAQNIFLNNSDLIRRFSVDFDIRFSKIIDLVEKSEIVCKFIPDYKEKIEQLYFNGECDGDCNSVLPISQLPFSLNTSNLFTIKEKEIIFLYYNQFNFNDISEKLHISKRTVDRHLVSIRKKLGCNHSGHIIPALLEKLKGTLK
jgi:DNA-binding CsgD family transcriptional regulator